MSEKNFLKFSGRAPVAIDKNYFTVGYGAGYDLNLDGSIQKILFSIHRDEAGDKLLLIPGEEKVRINGSSVSRPTELNACDRIEWKEHVALFLDDVLSTETKVAKKESSGAFAILQKLAMGLDQNGGTGSSLNEALENLVELAGAESGYLVSEVGSDADWKLLASVGDAQSRIRNEDRRRELVSSTILNEAIEKRKPVYVESMIGHPWETQASIIAAQIFSLACVPLIAGNRVFGAICLYTRTPGFSIRQNSLEELKIVATQVALLLSSRNELRRARHEVVELKNPTKLKSGSAIVYDTNQTSSVMAGVESRIQKLSQSELSIMVRGETGTGKELIAREIHRNSTRASGPFVAINCAAVPPSLMESTLFGYAKGAFTGAYKDRPGKFLQANGGTIFLDEIGDLPLDLQVKLLRVLQEKEVEAVGADKSVSVDFRVLTATHLDLEKAVAEGKFRKDLYYRLNGASIVVPPLRERGTDVLLLATHFLAKQAPGYAFSADAQARLKQHQWPGNVRELQQVVARAAALADGSLIDGDDLELGVSLSGRAAINQDFLGYEDFQSLKEVQLAFTRDFVKRMLEKFQGNRSKVSGHLGISERTLYRLLANSGDDSTL